MESERDSTGCPSCFSGARWALPLIENFTYFPGLCKEYFAFFRQCPFGLENIGDAKWFLPFGRDMYNIYVIASIAKIAILCGNER